MSRDRGFSLLELVVVLLIFALVALIGVQALRQSVRVSDSLTGVSEATGDLAYALALLRRDLEAALPMGFIPPGGGERAALVAGADGFGLTVGGLPRLAANASGQGRVVWALDRAGGTLTRQVWISRTPGGRPPPEVAVLSGVESLDLASFDVQGGWRAGFDADPREPERLPLGLRVRIGHAASGPLDIVVSLR